MTKSSVAIGGYPDKDYCEIRCKYDDNFITYHGMIDKDFNYSLNDQMIQSVSMLKQMNGVRDCVKAYSFSHMVDVIYIINDICSN